MVRRSEIFIFTDLESTPTLLSKGTVSDIREQRHFCVSNV